MSKYSSWSNPDGPLARRLIGFIDRNAHRGATVHECYPLFETSNTNHPDFASHGWISGALAVLHRDLAIVRLSEKRNGAKVYVTPDFIDSRKCEVQGRGGLTKEQVAHYHQLCEHLEYWMQVDSEGARIRTDQTKARRNMPMFVKQTSDIWDARPNA